MHPTLEQNPVPTVIETQHYLCFESSAGPRLLELSAVVEVLRMCALDHASGEGGQTYCGLLHYRGRTLPVFEFSPGPHDLRQPDYHLLVVRSEAEELVLVAREVHGIVNPEPAAVSSIRTGSRVLTVVHHEGSLLRVVDLAQLVDGSVGETQ